MSAWWLGWQLWGPAGHRCLLGGHLGLEAWFLSLSGVVVYPPWTGSEQWKPLCLEGEPRALGEQPHGHLEQGGCRRNS